MKLSRIIALAAILLGLAFPAIAIAPQSGSVWPVIRSLPKASSDWWQSVIEEWSSDKRLVLVAECESRFNPRAKGAAGEYGLLQFLPSTFDRMKLDAGYDWFNIKNPLHQIILADWAFSNGRAHEWSCLKLI